MVAEYQLSLNQSEADENGGRYARIDHDQVRMVRDELRDELHAGRRRVENADQRAFVGVPNFDDSFVPRGMDRLLQLQIASGGHSTPLSGSMSKARPARM